MKSYLQRMQTADVADRVVLLAHKELVPFYESLGFRNKGESAATFGGGGWYDLVSFFFHDSITFSGHTKFPSTKYLLETTHRSTISVTIRRIKNLWLSLER